MDQIFSVRQVCEEYIANGKDVFWEFIHLEKAYDTIDRLDSMACVLLGMDVSEWFPVNVQLKQGYVMSP